MKKFLHHEGYTLIEVLIALSIMVLTLAFAGPKFEEYTKSQQVKNTARQIYANLQTARLTAVKENDDVTATIDLVSPAMTVTRKIDDSDVIPEVDFLQDTPNIVLDSTRSGVIVFTPTGIVDGLANQTIEVSYPDPDIETKYNVIVSNSGRIKLEKDS
jgi:prepilin-type N-terminal cleavage/methylation domain-containing protein